MDGYMGKGEKDAWMAKDPVPAFRAWLVQGGHAAEAELVALEATIERQLDEAVEFALSSAVPDVSELRRDVFAEELTA
jgi:pyruvate dehydrogenase E1 component alpha subunit